MHIIKLLVLMLLFPLLCHAQEISVHKVHLEEFGLIEKQFAKSENLSTPIIPLQVKSKPDRVVFGYLPDWEYLNNSHQYFNYDLLTHIAAFDFKVEKNGNVGYPSGWPWTDLINKAHSNGVKVIMTAINFNGDDVHSIITSESAKTNFFSRTKSILENYKLDGVNIDFESLNLEDRGDRINNFMKELTNFIQEELPGKEVSFASPIKNWGGWKLKELSESCDYLFIMGYSFTGGWSSVTGPQAPYVSSNNNSISGSLNNEYAEVVWSNPKKLILGMPYYGNKWKASSSSAGATSLEHIKSIYYREAVNVYNQKGKNWSTKYKVPWIAWNDGDWFQVWCDDDSSLGLKIDLATSKDLLGIGMWALGYDGASMDLWNMLESKTVTDLESVQIAPKSFSLNQNYPNPFNPATTISYSIPTDKFVTLKIFDMLGREVASLVNENKTAGQYKLNWNSEHLASGVYIYQLRAGSFLATNKMILQK